MIFNTSTAIQSEITIIDEISLDGSEVGVEMFNTISFKKLFKKFKRIVDFKGSKK